MGKRVDPYECSGLRKGIKESQRSIQKEIRKIIFVGGEIVGAVLMLLFLLYVGAKK